MPNKIDYFNLSRLRIALLIIVGILTLQGCLKKDPTFIKITTKDKDISFIIYPYYNTSNLDYNPLLKSVLDNCNKSDIIIFEDNFHLLSLDEKREKYTPDLISYPNLEPKLKSIISIETYSKLDSILSKENYPSGAWDQFQPWFIALYELPRLEQKKSHFKSNILPYVSQYIKKDSIEYLFDFTNKLYSYSQLSYHIQEKILLDMIRIYNNKNEINKLINLLDNGNYNKLDSLVNFINSKDDLSKSLYDEIMINRNDIIFDKIENYANKSNKIVAFIHVYSVFGSNGIIQEFKKRGYNIRFY